MLNKQIDLNKLIKNKQYNMDYVHELLPQFADFNPLLADWTNYEERLISLILMAQGIRAFKRLSGLNELNKTIRKLLLDIYPDISIINKIYYLPINDINIMWISKVSIKKDNIPQIHWVISSSTIVYPKTEIDLPQVIMESYGLLDNKEPEVEAFFNMLKYNNILNQYHENEVLN